MLQIFGRGGVTVVENNRRLSKAPFLHIDRLLHRHRRYAAYVRSSYFIHSCACKRQNKKISRKK